MIDLGPFVVYFFLKFVIIKHCVFLMYQVSCSTFLVQAIWKCSCHLWGERWWSNKDYIRET